MGIFLDYTDKMMEENVLYMYDMHNKIRALKQKMSDF